MTIHNKKTITRSISLPVQECLSGEWKDFMRQLHSAWRQSTDLANWASQTCARMDVVRTPDMKELPRYESLDLYALAFGRAKESQGRQKYRCANLACNRQWQGFHLDDGRAPDHRCDRAPCPGSGQPTEAVERRTLPQQPQQYSGFDGGKIAAASLLRKVQGKYAKERGKVVWRRERRTPEYAYPYPFPVHQQAWVAYLGEQGEPIIGVGLPGGRVTVRLRRGLEFVPALRVLQKIIDGEIKAGELSICRQRSYCPDRKDTERFPGGGHRDSYRVMLRISYSYEVAAGLDDDTFCEVTTGADPFITISIQERLPWLLHRPDMKQFIVSHRAFLDRFADDLKYEKRWPRGKRRRMLRRQERGCDKQNRRLKTFCQQTAAQVVGYVQRRRITCIRWCDRDRSYAPSFPWFQLREAVRSKCEEAGIRFHLVETTEDKDESAA